MTKLQTIAARQMGVPVCTLLKETAAELPSCLVGDNFQEVQDSTLLSRRSETYGYLSYVFPSVDLVRLPSGVRLHRGRDFLISHDGYLLSEQVWPDSPIKLEQFPEATDGVECTEVDGPCVLAARYGMQTWGHWIGEIFPRVLLVEREFPGKFKYVVPQDIFNGTAPRNVWNSIWESFRSLRIGKDRIMRVWYEKEFTFKELYTVTSVFDKDLFHPKLIGIYKRTYDVPPGGLKRPWRNRRIAILRTESSARTITNLPEVVNVLRDFDYEFVEIGRLPFLDQISLFATARNVVGVLASGLTGLVFAGEGVRVLSFAPIGYVNKFFIRLVQHNSGVIYDVRGPIRKMDARSPIFSDFDVNPSHIREGLSALGG